MFAYYLKMLCFLLAQNNPADAPTCTQHHQSCKHTPQVQFLQTQYNQDVAPVLSANTTLEQENKISWSPAYRLSWMDFQGIPDTSLHSIAALTYSSIIYRRSCENDYLEYSVEAVFRRSDSWVREDHMTPYYLEHEQLHFDITEIYARKMRDALDNYVFKCDQTDLFDMVVNNVLRDWRKAEVRYDYETDFSHNKNKQRNWYIWTHSELEKTKGKALIK